MWCHIHHDLKLIFPRAVWRKIDKMKKILIIFRNCLSAPIPIWREYDWEGKKAAWRKVQRKHLGVEALTHDQGTVMGSFQITVLGWGKPTGVAHTPRWVAWVIELDTITGSQKSRGFGSTSKGCMQPHPLKLQKRKQKQLTAITL